MAFLLVGALALAVAIAPDAVFAAVLSGVLRRATKPETVSDWHRLQHAALIAGALATVLGVAGVTQWRRIEPVFDRLCGALQRLPNGWAFDCGVVLVVLGAVHGTSLVYGQLRGDDYPFLREARIPLSDTILRTWGGHVLPLWRVEGLLLYRAWGLHPVPFRWWLFAHVAILAFVQARILSAWGISRSARLVGLVVLCGWTQWAQLTMGYWTVSMSVKVWIATSIAVLAVIGDERPSAIRKTIIALAALAAILEDSAGAIVVPALVIAAVASGLRSGLTGRDLLRRSAWPVAVAVSCAVAFFLGQWLVHLEAMPLLGALGGGSFIDEALYLFSFGTVGALVAPLVTTQLPTWVVDGLSVPLSVGIACIVWLAWRHGSRKERAPLVYNLGLLICGLIMVVGARPYVDYYFMIGWTHYIVFLYVPMAGAIAVMWQETRRIRAWHPALAVQYLVIGCAVFFGAQEASATLDDRMLVHGGRRWEQRDALNRRSMIELLRDSLFTPLASVVPSGGRLPQMLSTALDARFPNLHPLLPLSFYDEAAGVPRGRFQWVVGPYANGVEYDTTDAIPVMRMKGVVDPAFRTALHRSGWWRDTYFASAPMEPTLTLPIACDASRHGADPLVGDADRRHWLLLSVGANGATELPTFVDVVFRTEYRPRAVYRVAIAPATRGCIRVELLNLPELVLSDEVQLLGLEESSPRHIELVGLFPPGARRP